MPYTWLAITNSSAQTIPPAQLFNPLKSKGRAVPRFRSTGLYPEGRDGPLDRAAPDRPFRIQPLHLDEIEVLFAQLAERYERGSVMLTSNLPFSGWESIFKDPMTTAAIDRLVHHSVILELNVPSYRAEQAKKSQRSQAEPMNARKEG